MPDSTSHTSPFILDTEMIQDDDLDQFDDQYFSSSLAFEPTTSSPGNILADDFLFESHRSPLDYNSPRGNPAKLDVLKSDASVQVRPQAPSLHSSNSPAGSFRDSSSDSSAYNRKSSSDSSQSPSMPLSSTINDMDAPEWKADDEMMAGTDGTLFFASNGTIDPSAMNNGFFNDKEMENSFDFESAASSPSPFAANAQNMESPEMPTMKYETPSKNSPKVSKMYKQNRNSQHSITQSMLGLTTSGSREASPLSAMVTSQESSPSNLFNNSPSPMNPVEFVNGPMVGGNMPNPVWPQNFDFSMVNPHMRTGLTPPSVASNVPSPLSNAMRYDGPYSFSLTVHPTPLKSRVETQIPIKLTLFPLPPGITKLHLPTHTISKPKLLAKPTPERAPDTLELHTMLVCSSAMQNPEYLRRAFTRAAAASAPSSKESSPRDGSQASAEEEDDVKPSNGGEVKICSGCITRERKRAARKKIKKQEEEEAWYKDEKRRVVVFNTQEMKEWSPPTSQVPSEATGDRPEPIVPEGAMQVDAPMRIACYCRHQNEKLGFQVILTIKDYQDRLIAQTITSTIMITDDHKTHTLPNMPQGANGVDGQIYGPGGMFASENTFDLPSTPFRMSHSSSDLQSLQRNFAMAPNMAFGPPPVTAMGGAPSSIPSQTTSASMTPRNLSRQGSPTGATGPSTKKRKASGSGKVPSGLAMTRLETAPGGNAPASAAGPTSASSATSPFMPNMNGFQMTDAGFAQPPGSMVPPASHFNTGPPTPNSNDQLFFGNNNRSQSMDNLAMHQLYSAPASAHPSRAPSPSGMRSSVQAYQQQQQAQIAQAVANGIYGMPLSLNPHRPPVINKMIPGEGPKAGGIEVTCLGSGFCQGLEVMFGDVKATTTTFWGETSLVCLLPPSTFAGTVPVTFKHQHQQQQQMQPFSNPAVPKSAVIFKYVDDDEQQIIRLALSVLGHKMNGKMEDVTHLARRIVGDGNHSWPAGSSQSPPGGMGGHQQVSGFSAATFGVDVESTLLRCLDLVDLDDSPRLPRLNLRKNSGQTMLHLACSLGLHRFVAALLARGANPEPRDKGGFTPMHFAAMHDYPQIVRRLILSGADPTMRTLQGHTPADLASSPEVLQSTRRFQHHSRTRSTGSLRSRTSSAASLRSLWEGPTMTPVTSHPMVNDQQSQQETSDDEDDVDINDSADADQEDAFWMKTKNRAASRRPSAQHANSSSMLTKNNLLELPTATDNPNGLMSPTVAAMSAFRDQLSAQIAHLQQSMHLNFPQMPNLPDYQAYLPTAPMVRRISAMVPTIGTPRPGSSDQNAKENDYKWWDLFSGNPPAAPPAYDEIFPGSEMDTKRASAEQAAADTVADQKCAKMFDKTEIIAESSAARPVQETLRIGHKNSITREQQEQFQMAHAEKVKRFRSDRNLFFIWIPLLVVIIVSMLYNRVPQIWTSVNEFVDLFRGQDRIVEVL